MEIKSFCNVIALYLQLLDWYVSFGPERPDSSPDPAFGLLVDSLIEFNQTQSMWKTWPGGSDIEVCYI